MNDLLQWLTFIGIVIILIFVWQAWTKINQVTKIITKVTSTAENIIEQGAKRVEGGIVNKISEFFTNLNTNFPKIAGATSAPNGANVANGAKGANPVTVKYYSADWCPHCKNFADTWNKLVETFKNQSNIILKKIDMTAQNVAQKIKSELKLKNNAPFPGYPTVTVGAGAGADAMEEIIEPLTTNFDKMVAILKDKIVRYQN